MDTETAKQNLLTLSFMRSKAKSTQTSKARPSLIEMTREEFKERLNQHKPQSGKIIH